MTGPSFDHLLALSDDIGTFEHADHRAPRRSHGYCTDDVARVLVVVAREPDPDPAVLALGRTAMRFLLDAKGVAGHIRNRRDADGRWSGSRGVEDCWGRAIWAFGTAAARSTDSWARQSGHAAFDRAIEQRSPWTRAMAFAALGAAEVLAADPHHYGARALLTDAALVIGPPRDDPAWPWPEPRLTYANAALPEVLLAAGHLLDRPELVTHGVGLLGWLLDRETLDDHLSPTPVGGAGPDDDAPAFDQQPIEAAAMADACARAAEVTGDLRWQHGLDLAIGWFLGNNDVGVTMIDVDSGGGYDGLEPGGRNLNQGAESTLALLSTLQHAHRRSAVPA
jgi:hypothetical protein